MTDDQGYGDLSCHGNPVLKTPELDKLWSESVRLTDFHASSLCTPSRASLMTGRDCLRTGAWATTRGRSLLRKDETTMADVFAACGYRTGLFGKWHLGDNYPFRPQDRGFQEVLWHLGGGLEQTPDYWGNNYFDDRYWHNGKLIQFTGYCTDVWFDGAMSFIKESVGNGQPFFAYIATNAPHDPYRVDPKYSEPYRKAGIEAKRANFYGMIANLDENMARLLDLVDRLGIRENTILIFLSDNGTSAGASTDNETQKILSGFNAGMRGIKTSYYDGGHRVPCFVRWPSHDLQGGRDIAELTSINDLLPTLIDLCGLEKPKDVAFDGTSLATLLLGKVSALPERTLFVHIGTGEGPHGEWRGTVMRRKWRLVGGKELYDISTDPGQQDDVSSQHPEVVQSMRADYAAWWKGIASGPMDPCPIIIGSDRENPSCLTCFDWAGTKGATAWAQYLIRTAENVNGWWNIEVERDGTYEFSLRRWPEESNLPINGAPDKAGYQKIGVTAARIKVGGIVEEQPVPEDAAAVVFTIPLPAGETRLQTWFLNEQTNDPERGAYYVYVKRL
jgi:arylsulfatase A-like enzyme